MSALFVGRLPLDLRPRELEDLFIKYGRISRCDVKRGGYGFVEYEDPRDAEDAIKYCDGMRAFGGRIVVEWARGSNRGGGRGGAPSGGSDECFKCGRTGHWARDCPMVRGGPPSRDYDRRDRDRDLAPRGSSDRDRSYGSSSRRDRRRSRSRSRSRSPVGRSRSRSPVRARDRSRSPSPARSAS